MSSLLQDEMFPEGLAGMDVENISSVLAQPIVQVTGEVAGRFIVSNSHCFSTTILLSSEYQISSFCYLLGTWESYGLTVPTYFQDFAISPIHLDNVYK